MVRNQSGMSTATKVGVGLVVVWIGLKLLPVVLGVGAFFTFMGIAITGAMLSWIFSGILSIGVPLFLIYLVVSAMSSDD